MPFRWPDFRRLFAAAACSTLASRAFAVVLGYEVYEITHSPLALGILGLIEAIPALSLALFGGHIADRHDRRRILRLTLGALVFCTMTLGVLDSVISGTRNSHCSAESCSSRESPAALRNRPRLRSKRKLSRGNILVHSSTLMAELLDECGRRRPAGRRPRICAFGAAWTYLGNRLLVRAGVGFSHGLTPRPAPPARDGESLWESVATGVRYVFEDQVMFGSMSLDLFAVLFGGAIALLPVFASDILKVGPIGLGILNAAPTTGGLVSMLWCQPPSTGEPCRSQLDSGRHGVRHFDDRVCAVEVVSCSRSRRCFSADCSTGSASSSAARIQRLLSPDHLRGRIASVSMIFIGSSNELGAFESGVAASLLGTVVSVWVGGILTLVVVAVTAVLAPKLRRLSLDPARVSAARPRDGRRIRRRCRRPKNGERALSRMIGALPAASRRFP